MSLRPACPVAARPLRPASPLLAVLLIASVAAALAGRASASIPTPPTDRRNAATWYAEAIAAYDASLDRFGRDAGPLAVVMAWEETGGPPTGELRRAFGDLEGVLEPTRRGAACRFCDWHLDRTQGLELLLPHVGRLRALGRLLALESDLLVHDGRSGAAMENLEAIYRMGRHVTEDDVLISTLVGMALFRLADARVDRAFGAGAIGPGEAAGLRRAVGFYGDRDPFGTIEAVAGEQALFGDWIYERFGDADARANIDDDLFGGEGPAEVLGGMTDEAFDEAFARYDAAMDEVVEIFMLDDPDEQAARMTAFEATFEAGFDAEEYPYGELAQMFMPAFGRVLEQRREIEATLAARVASLDEILVGADPLDRMNAAVLYGEAARRLEPFGRARLERFFTDGVPDRPAGAAHEAGAATVADSAESPDSPDPASPRLTAEIVDEVAMLVQAGHDLESCDFEQLRIADHGRFAPRSLPAFRDLVRLLIADAARRDRTVGDAAERLARAIRLGGRLAGEPRVLAALIAHDGFDRAVALAEDLLARGAGPETRALLLAAVESLGRADPFGHVAAGLDLRDTVEARLEWRWQQRWADGPALDATTVPTRVQGWSIDRLLAIAIAIEWSDRREILRRAEAEGRTPPAVLAADLAPVADLLDLEALALVQSDLDRWESAVLSADLDALEALPAPAVAGIVEQVRRARRDVARALALLRPGGTETDGDEAPDGTEAGDG